MSATVPILKGSDERSDTDDSLNELYINADTRIQVNPPACII